MKISIHASSKEVIPEYGSEFSAGADLKAAIDGTVVIPPGGRRLIPTGIRLELPAGYEAQVRPRSGLALKRGVTVLNSPGTIDSDYRGEVGVILINHGEADFEIAKGDRIAQMVVSPVTSVEFVPIFELNETARGAGGFGSTGR